METTDSNKLMSAIRKEEHGGCILCGNSDHFGLDLKIDRVGQGEVRGKANPSTFLQSYKGEVHGGIISLLLDGIMTNCLFAEGILAVTGRLVIRYLHSVESAKPVELWANLTKSKGKVHFVEASLTQDDEVKAIASATFMDRKVDE